MEDDGIFIKCNTYIVIINHFCPAFAFIAWTTIFCSSIKNARIILEKELHTAANLTTLYPNLSRRHCPQRCPPYARVTVLCLFETDINFRGRRAIIPRSFL